MLKRKSPIKISDNMCEAVYYRYKKYFRFNNSDYWKKYYLPKIKANDLGREKLYSKIIRYRCGKGANVVDIGSGYGFLAKEMTNQQLKVTCVDLFNEMLDEAKKRVAAKDANFIQADILNLPFKENTFDCIVLESVIEHFPMAEVQEDILPYMHKLIRPQGFLFIHVPVKSLHSIIARFSRKYIQNDLPQWAIDDDGDVTHKMWLTYKQYINLIESHGFSNINYDFRLTRSNAKPPVLFFFMKKIQELLKGSDEELHLNLAEESSIIRLRKMIKSHLALTSYLLFKKD